MLSVLHAARGIALERTDSLRPFRCFFSAITHGMCADHGFLKGAVDKLWTQELDIQSCVALINEAGMLWRAVTEDASHMGTDPDKYMRTVRNQSREFVQSKQLHGRSEVMNGLYEGSERGQFMLMLGPQDVGKSLTLQSMEDALNERETHIVVTVTGRKGGSDMGMALFKALAPHIQKHNVDLSGCKGAITCIMARIIQWSTANAAFPGPGLGAEGFGMLIDVLLTPEEKHEISVDAVLDFFEDISYSVWRGERIPTVFIDDIQLVLSDETVEAAKATKAILARLVRDTKERRAFQVVLATSEHSEMCRLRKLGFSSAHFSRTIFVSEAAPSEMDKLVYGTWVYILRVHVWLCMTGTSG